jgi:hypothetical protein
MRRGGATHAVRWVRDRAHFDTLMSRRFDEGGPVLLAAKMTTRPAPRRPPRDPVLIRQHFMRGLGIGRQSALDA